MGQSIYLAGFEAENWFRSSSNAREKRSPIFEKVTQNGTYYFFSFFFSIFVVGTIDFFSTPFWTKRSLMPILAIHELTGYLNPSIVWLSPNPSSQMTSPFFPSSPVSWKKTRDCETSDHFPSHRPHFRHRINSRLQLSHSRVQNTNRKNELRFADTENYHNYVHPCRDRPEFNS